MPNRSRPKVGAAESDFSAALSRKNRTPRFCRRRTIPSSVQRARLAVAHPARLGSASRGRYLIRSFARIQWPRRSSMLHTHALGTGALCLWRRVSAGGVYRSTIYHWRGVAQHTARPLRQPSSCGRSARLGYAGATAFVLPQRPSWLGLCTGCALLLAVGGLLLH